MDQHVDLSTAQMAQTVRSLLRPITEADLSAIVQAAASGATAGADRQAATLARAHTVRTVLILAAVMVGLMGVTGAAAWLAGREHGRAEVMTTAGDLRAAFADGAGGGKTWQNLISLNRGIAETVGACRVIPQASGQPACAIPLWVGPARAPSAPAN